MMPDLFVRSALVPALSLLPPRMDTPSARAMVLAICLQESRLLSRRQVNGPAKGYPQFELAGVEGVLTHRATALRARDVCLLLDVGPTAPSVYLALEYQDVLACCFARLLIWTLPAPLPTRSESELGYGQYLAAWRPGRPRPDAWSQNFEDGWRTVDALGVRNV